MSPDGLPSGHINDPENRIDEAFTHFTERVAEYLIDEGPGDPAIRLTKDSQHSRTNHEIDRLVAERARMLRITLCDLLKVVSITLESDDNAQVIFETLNARGTPLLSLDLAKNAVFHQAMRQKRDADALYDQVWRPQLDDDYWRQMRRQGRLNRPIGELFLMHWLTMRLERVIPATELFAAFRQGVLEPTSDAEALIHELADDAAIMRSFDQPTPGTRESTFFKRLEALDAGTIMPIALLVFRSSEITQARRHRCLQILESWLVRRALMRLTAKNYNRLVPRLVARMKSDPAHADEALHEALSGGESAVSRWPSDDEFMEFVRTRDIYGTVSQPRITMALAAVEASLYSNKTDVIEIPDSLSIEHLIPQQWETYWPLTANEGDVLTDMELERSVAERAARIHRLGNLTIVAHPLNSSLSNSGWSVKRTELNKHSRLLLNARLAEYENWNEQSIDDHGAWLAEQLVAIWPGPESSQDKAQSALS